MTFGQRKELAQRLRAIPLETVLTYCGAQPDRYDHHKWHTSAGVLSVTAAKFINWNTHASGGGAIDLVMHLNQLDFKAALDWLAHHFPQTVPLPFAPSILQSPLQLPTPAPSKLERVIHYLVHQRALTLPLIQPLLDSGTLYADGRANAVFLLLGKDNRPVGAELRGTSEQQWRGLAPGSQKNLGYFSIPPTSMPTLILCESAIDALSCFALHPQHRCLSTAGATPNPRWMPALLAQDCKIHCGFDADPIGDAMANDLIARHPSIQRLRPSLHDWNDVLKASAP
jgi:hypothetical protein